jgi:5-deoxy-glucuronate isomerase
MLLLLAADHPARGALRIGDDPLAMANRPDLLRRLVIGLENERVDGVLASADILEDLASLGLLEGRLVIGTMNRGGLYGARWELDDRMTAYDAEHVATAGLDGGKVLLRLDDEDPGTASTLEACARAVTGLADRQLLAMVEPLPYTKDAEGRAVVDHSPDKLVRAAVVASGLGSSSAYTWLKVPAGESARLVLDATTCPALLLGGPRSSDLGATLAAFAEALDHPHCRGLVVGRNLLYPADGDVAGAVGAAANLLAGRARPARAGTRTGAAPARVATANVPAQNERIGTMGRESGAGAGTREADGSARSRLYRPAGTLSQGRYAVLLEPEQAGWTYCGLRILELEPGGVEELDTGDEELAVLPLCGSLDVVTAEVRFGLAGRGSVFEATTDWCYVPIRTAARLQSTGGCTVALASARATERFEPVHIPAADVLIEVRGAGPATRQVNNFMSPGAFAGASKLMCVEVLTPDGNWSSYPPHRHDDSPECPVNNEEIYYFRVGGPADSSFAYHRTYTPDGSIDERVIVHDGDIFLIPRGYHGPTVAAPGYPLYYLNVLAGPGGERSMAFCDDPTHAWVRATWEDMAPDARCPMTSATGPVRVRI